MPPYVYWVYCEQSSLLCMQQLTHVCYDRWAMQNRGERVNLFPCGRVARELAYSSATYYLPPRGSIRSTPKHTANALREITTR